MHNRKMKKPYLPHTSFYCEVPYAITEDHLLTYVFSDLLLLLSGIYPPSHGKIFFRSKHILKPSFPKWNWTAAEQRVPSTLLETLWWDPQAVQPERCSSPMPLCDWDQATPTGHTLSKWQEQWFPKADLQKLRRELKFIARLRSKNYRLGRNTASLEYQQLFLVSLSLLLLCLYTAKAVALPPLLFQIFLCTTEEQTVLFFKVL